MKRNVLTIGFFIFGIMLAFSQDIIVESIMYTEGNYTRLQPFEGKIKIKNSGATAITNQFLSEIYFSVDDELDEENDYYAGFVLINGLDAGESKEMDINGVSNQFGIDVNPGDYYVLIKADIREDVAETDENNNILSGEERIHILPSDVDLTSNGWLVQSGNELGFGDEFIISVNFINLGQDNIKSAYYEYFLSTDDFFDDADVRIGYLNYAGFDWLGSAAVYDEITIPNTIIKNDYNVLLRINDRGQEIEINDKDMTNNILNVGQVHIDGIPIFTTSDDMQTKTAYSIMNPVGNYLRIFNLEKGTEIAIYSMSGKLLISQNYEERVDISSLRTGTYIAIVDGSAHKIIKQ